MYTDRNFRTKKALREALAAGAQIGVFQPNGDLFGAAAEAPTRGEVAVEGPHYPAPHSWYATVTLVDGVITRVK